MPIVISAPQTPKSTFLSCYMYISAPDLVSRSPLGPSPSKLVNLEGVLVICNFRTVTCYALRNSSRVLTKTCEHFTAPDEVENGHAGLFKRFQISTGHPPLENAQSDAPRGSTTGPDGPGYIYTILCDPPSSPRPLEAASKPPGRRTGPSGAGV